jgi:rubredoxin
MYDSAYDIIGASALPIDNKVIAERQFDASFRSLDGDCVCPACLIEGKAHVAKPSGRLCAINIDLFNCGACGLTFSVPDNGLVMAGRQ